MPASQLSHMQWYFRDWLISETRFGFTPEERSAYFDVLCLCYSSDDGTINWNVDYLVGFLGVNNTVLNSIQRAFKQCSTGVETERWTHPRVQREFARIEKQREKNSRSGKTSASRRLSTHRSNQSNGRKTPVQPSDQIISDLNGVSPYGKNPIQTPGSSPGPPRLRGADPAPPPDIPDEPIPPMTEEERGQLRIRRAVLESEWAADDKAKAKAASDARDAKLQPLPAFPDSLKEIEARSRARLKAEREAKAALVPPDDLPDFDEGEVGS